MKFFLYNPATGFAVFSTEKEALEAANEAIDEYRDGEWVQEVEEVCVGKITHVAIQKNVRKDPDEVYDYLCDYEMEINE